MRRRKPLQRRTRLRARRAVRRAHARRESPQLADARKAARDRARDRCEVETPACQHGWHVGHHAHHVRLRSQGGPDDESNLLWVCADAHRWIHANVAQSYARGWLKRTAA